MKKIDDEDLEKVLPQRIFALFCLGREHGFSFWNFLWRQFSSPRDKDLTFRLLNYHETGNSLLIDENNNAFVFIWKSDTGEWEVYDVGAPVYEVSPEMVDQKVDFKRFLSKLQKLLPGVQVKRGSASETRFTHFFKEKLTECFDEAVEACL